MQVLYHLTDPVKGNKGERRQLVERTVELVSELRDTYPMAEIIYLSMFSRHVVRCCREISHMQEDDCFMVSGFGRGVESEVRETLQEMGA